MPWYNNSQGPVETIGDAQVEVPDSGNYVFTYLDVPHGGDRQIMLVSDFVVTVQGDDDEILDVNAQIGVSNPSEDDRPMRPFHGVLHSVSRARILPGSMAVLHVVRLDVIDPATPMPWKLNGDPRLAPQVFAPAGTRVCNCAVRVVEVG